MKPLRQEELRRTAGHIEEKLREERTEASILKAENIFMSCINGQLQPDEDFHEMTRKKLGFTVKDPGAVFALWLGSMDMRHRKKRQKGFWKRPDVRGTGRSPACWRPVRGISCWWSSAAWKIR